MVTPTGTALYEIYDQVRVDIFGTNEDWTASAASGIPTSAMDIYAQKIASRINLHTSHNHVTLNFTTGIYLPPTSAIAALLEMGMLMVIKETEQSLMKRLRTGLGLLTIGTAEGAAVKNADGVSVSTVIRYQERLRAFLSDKNTARKDFKEALRQYKYDHRAGSACYVY